MLDLLRLIPPLVVPALTGAQGEFHRHCRRIALTAVAAITAIMGSAMLVGAAFLHLAETIPAPTAAMVVGAGLLVIAGIIAAAAMLPGRANSRPAMGNPPDDRAAKMANILVAAEAAINRDARSETPLLALSALVAGCALGASPQLRRALAGLIR